jgi:enterochelin esterase-like enzyme
LLEPQSTLLFLIFIAIFGALACWLVVAKQVVFRVLAACLAFLPAVAFGVAAVNKYYDYYQTWGAAFSDVTGQVPAAPPKNVAGKPGVQFGTFLGQTIDTGLAAQQGFTLPLGVSGRLSHLTRTVYVYLPPQYFQAAYQLYRFPVIELIHGYPGSPQDWITVLNANATLNSLMSERLAKPAVLVMPDANGGLGVSLQCLNIYRGPQDDTYLSDDVPDYIAAHLRVQPPGKGWGIAGYSEGGFCAANLGLRHGKVFSYAGVLSGYFAPDPNLLENPKRLVSGFGSPLQRRENTPMDLLQQLPATAPIAQFWLGVGGSDRGDIRIADDFRQLLELRQPLAPPIAIVRGGGHTMFTWRELMPRMLSWMTNRLAAEAEASDRLAAGHRHPVAAAGPGRVKAGP